MYKRIWVFLFLTLLTVLVGYSQEGRNSRRDRKHTAVNSYVKFANESIHLLWQLHLKLEKFNEEANQYQAGNLTSINFSTRKLVQNLSFNSQLKAGSSATKPSKEGILVDLKDLYEKTSEENSYIPTQERIKLNKFRDNIYFNLISLLGLTDSLSQYVRIGQYKVDTKMKHAYGLLEKMAKIYTELQVQKDELEKVCKELSEPIPLALKSLQNIIHYSRELVVAVRNDKKSSIPQLGRMLQRSVEVVEEQKKNTKANLLGLSLYYSQERSGYVHMIHYAEQVRLRAMEFANDSWVAKEYELYGPTYYFYNERMLSVFNQHKYGITAYYNRFISFANQVFVLEFEEVPLFKVLPPEMSKTQESGMQFASNTLEGAASNNLVFLLDVSASMDRPEKLNLLKESISFLVDLMRPEDEISIIIYSGDARVILNPTSAMFKAEIKSAIRSMKPGGKTKALQGLKEAYKLAEKNYIAGGNNRIIMASDGAFEVNDALLRYVGKRSSNSVCLSVLLFNKLENKDVARELTQLAQRGNGNYSHVKPENAKFVLVQEANSIRKQ
ncbi:MAG: VWA domain-containing protein [Bacteroidota bacterium]